MNDILAYIAAALVGLWGVSHAIPTARVVAGFEPITTDNRRVLVQEWLAEAFTMWGLAAVIVVSTAVGVLGRRRPRGCTEPPLASCSPSRS